MGVGITVYSWSALGLGFFAKPLRILFLYFANVNLDFFFWYSSLRSKIGFGYFLTFFIHDESI